MQICSVYWRTGTERVRDQLGDDGAGLVVELHAELVDGEPRDPQEVIGLSGGRGRGDGVHRERPGSAGRTGSVAAAPEGSGNAAGLPSPVELRLDAVGRDLGIFVLPDPQNAPSSADEQLRHLGIAGAVAFDLRPPEVGVVRRPARILRAAMPEAAVDKDGNPGASKYEIGAPPDDWCRFRLQLANRMCSELRSAK